MYPSRRSVLASLAGVGVAGLAGCLDSVPVDGGPLTFDSAVATVPDPTLSETGYAEHEVEEFVVERSYEVADRQVAVLVTNWAAEYDRAIDLGDLGLPISERIQAAVFTVVSTPQVSVLGQEFNPVAGMDSAELAETMQDRYENIGPMRQVGMETATVLGVETEVGEFETTARLVGTAVTIDLTLQVAAAVESGTDLVLAVGGYPTAIAETERPGIHRLLAEVEHAG